MSVNITAAATKGLNAAKVAVIGFPISSAPSAAGMRNRSTRSFSASTSTTEL